MTAVAAAIAPPTHCWKNTETRRLASHTWVRWIHQATISASRPTIHRAPNMRAAAPETIPNPSETSKPPQRPERPRMASIREREWEMLFIRASEATC